MIISVSIYNLINANKKPAEAGFCFCGLLRASEGFAGKALC